MTTKPPNPPRKKLIEVALPLEAINRESAREKSIRHGHPSTLHLWWARRPLAACRAVLFASLVDDPSGDPQYRNPDGSVDEERAAEKRAQLFNLIEELVKWENSNNPKVIDAARAEIARCVASRKIELGELRKETVVFGPEAVKGKPHTKGPIPGERGMATAYEVQLLRARPEEVNAFIAEFAPPVLDPFCGGGSIPLEAQRLGLRAFASDLNPVPVLITKALIEIPPKFAGLSPVNPDSRGEGKSSDSNPGGGKPGKRKKAATNQVGTAGSQGSLDIATQWKGAAGLAADVHYYGQWMRDEAQQRIGHLYPKIKVDEAMARDRKDLKPYVGQELAVIAWIWARTVPSPNPAAGGAYVPLVRSYWLSTKKGKESWVEPVIAADQKWYRFEVRTGTPARDFDPRKGTVVRTGATCLLTNQPMPFEHVRAEGKAGRMSAKLMAIVAEGERGRVYLSPTTEHEKIAEVPLPKDIPDTPIPEQALGFRVQLYGMDRHYKLFTPRQLVALTTFSDLVMEARAKVFFDAQTNGMHVADSYADAVATYLAFAVSRVTDYASTLTTWASNPQMEILRSTFARQALPMIWDFAEGNVFGPSSGTLDIMLAASTRAIERLGIGPESFAVQADATAPKAPGIVISTDPPYYDNIGYADLSDWFYVWLRRSIGGLYPDLFRTLLTPKAEELIATPHRHGGSKEKARSFFESGLGNAFERMREAEHRDFPMTVFYAFKQAESDEDEGNEEGMDSSTVSTGWETMLEGLLKAGFAISGTWPVRTERSGRSVSIGTNALASSIVLVCHPRNADAPLASRKEFIAALKRELPEALRNLQSGNIAPVDLAQAAIGPGMAVFSRYCKVLETNGERMGVRAALSIINQMLDEVLSEQEGEYDADTRWSIKWFEQYAHDDGPYGVAETLCKAMAVGVNGLVDAGIVAARSGKVRLLKRTELPADWDPATDDDICHWEVCQHLIRRFDDGGEQAAGDLLRKVGGIGEIARDLAYRLYTTCERKKWAQEAMSYNTLVVAWPEIQKLAMRAPSTGPTDETLFAREQT